MLYTPSYGNSQLKMEILEFTSKEAAAPLMSLAAPLWFWKFWKKILDFGLFSEILNFLKILKIMSYNFQSRKQISTLRGVYFLKISKTTQGPPMTSKGPPPPYQ